MTLKFDGWPWKMIGHLFYTTSSFVHHFKSIGELKLKLQSRNAQFGSKSAIFLSRVTLKFDGCPWKTIGHLFYVASSFVHYFTAFSEFKLELQSGNAQSGSNSTFFKAVRPWIKLCASFHTHWWIQIWVTVRKRSIQVKSDDCLSRVT